MKNLPRFYTPGDIAALTEFNRLRHDATAPAVRAILERAFEALYGASQYLAVYGSLAPGRENHRVVAQLAGDWREGFVHGDLSPAGWGAALGFPALQWRPDGPRVPVHLLCSDRLTADEWARLDQFEGAEYRRVLVPVYHDSGLLAVANLYEGNQ